ncbi:hypothetical protein DL767_007059 [Monosporascus sp. MG133]|nr:hypothetical protein DL767_007059 [Monosporascus sp. MG133]
MISYLYRLNYDPKPSDASRVGKGEAAETPTSDYDLKLGDASRVDEGEAAETPTYEEAPAGSTRALRTRPELVAHAKVYIFAEKCLISGLKALTFRKFATSVYEYIDVDNFAYVM